MSRKQYSRGVCRDWFSMSVQAGETAYSEPRKDRAPAYTKVEVGYPSDVAARLMPYVEDRHLPLSTIYVCCLLYTSPRPRA